MTPFPWSIEASRSVAEAREMMDAHGIHHLPVTRNAQLVGVISDRKLASARTRDRVGDLCVGELYVVELGSRLDEVLLHMARTRSDAAVITRNGKLAGILTATDACRAYGEDLRRRFPPDGGDEAA